jgi:hypothetical protein
MLTFRALEQGVLVARASCFRVRRHPSKTIRDDSADHIYGLPTTRPTKPGSINPPPPLRVLAGHFPVMGELFRQNHTGRQNSAIGWRIHRFPCVRLSSAIIPRVSAVQERASTRCPSTMRLRNLSQTTTRSGPRHLFCGCPAHSLEIVDECPEYVVDRIQPFNGTPVRWGFCGPDLGSV